MSSAAPVCKTITISAFRGDRTAPFAIDFQTKLDDQKNGRASGLTILDCLRFAGHTGVSIDNGASIWGFHPDGSGVPVWQLIDS